MKAKVIDEYLFLYKRFAAMKLINCNRLKHSDEILFILNDAIANSTALYDYSPRTLQSMDQWFDVKEKGNFPVIGAVDDSDQLMGFATWGSFRAFPAYKYTVEHSLYVHPAHRGKGLGKALLQALINSACQAEVHVLVGCIDASNAASIHLHTQFGFTHSGTIKEVGFKFGRWLDAAFYQLNLNTPLKPVDG
ncbi:GNAT family N-acetyltransferase [Methylophilus sp.]|uniref:GNAT family N-acetyltransferase n=1 Tax=Methylophilus sp. TaxID=29541 RepID=UPI0040375D2E